MNTGRRGRKVDPFLLNYNASDLQIASEFLSNWLPFLSRGLCRRCTQTLSDRIRSVHPVDGDTELHSEKKHTFAVLTPDNLDLNDNSDAYSLGSWKDVADTTDAADANSLRSWRNGANLSAEPVTDGLTSETVGFPAAPVEGRKVRMSWADMAQEDELEGEGAGEGKSEEARQAVIGHGPSGEETAAVKVQTVELSREQREHIRFSNVKRKKDFICLERVKGKIVNILEGLELHTGVFSAVEQKRIVDFVYKLQEMGKQGELKERTYAAPQKWMRGKGRVTVQFGCCYNYAQDKHGNPPGILQHELVDPIPHLFKVIIRRLIGWHVLPPSCVPDSCIVNIYGEGDCIPPHIDNHDFVRPFCTVSFLSECNIVFGSNLKVVGAGEFSGSVAIPLPVGSVLVLNGNGADVAKHCVPAVPTKRISITFRKMDESKRPIGFVPEPDLQGLEPLSYETDRSKSLTSSKSKLSVNRQPARREDNRDNGKGLARKGNYWEPQISFRTQQGPSNRQS